MEDKKRHRVSSVVTGMEFSLRTPSLFDLLSDSRVPESGSEEGGGRPTRKTSLVSKSNPG